MERNYEALKVRVKSLEDAIAYEMEQADMEPFGPESDPEEALALLLAFWCSVSHDMAIDRVVKRKDLLLTLAAWAIAGAVLASFAIQVYVTLIAP